MNNITLSTKKTTPPVEEPQEFCPIQLFWLVSGQFGWDIYQFALVYGWDAGTIQKWIYKVQRPSRKAKIVAYLLKKEWGL